ncbi:hypothetical protein CK203_085688 [Vitis vinifera]|uniref:Uncharacterized protein n=1 Tax=Vitis vinifera TaxID=29760 RepID=A0A438BLN3_VITVI|nr:hypothetical protein CK203_085688 [Vitis vinifera]
MRDFAASAKLALRCETVHNLNEAAAKSMCLYESGYPFAKSVRTSFDSSAKIFAAAKPSLAHECHFVEQKPPFRSCESAAKLQSVKIPVFAVKAPFRKPSVHSPCPSPTTHESPIIFLRSPLPAKSRQSDMERTRGAKSSSPSSYKRIPRGAPVQGSTSEPPRSKAVSPPAKPAPQNPPTRRYLTKPSPPPSPVPAPAPPAQPQELQTPLSKPQIPSEVAPELCFDTATFQVRPELADSFRLLRRYHMEHLLAPRDFFYPRVAMDFYQSMTTKQRSFYKSTSVEGELPPSMFLIDALLRHNIYPLQHWTQRRGVLLEALFKISEGYFFSPHHLIMAALLYFEEKILEHLGYPSDPQLEGKRICWEVFTLDKWNNMTAYRVEQPGRPQPAEIPVARRASPRHIPEGIPIASPTISRAPPVTPASSEPSTSAEPRMAIPISEYRELCRSLQTLTASQSSLAQEMAAIRACQEQMLTTQAQYTAILRQLQHHLGLPSVAEHLSSTTAVPYSQATEPQAPPEEATEEAEPSA